MFANVDTVPLPPSLDPVLGVALLELDPDSLDDDLRAFDMPAS
jgi:hypothetical protein